MSDLSRFVAVYENVNTLVENLFKKIESLSQKYKTTKYRESHEYDHFVIRYSCIDMHGSYSVRGDCGNVTHSVSIKEMEDMEKYLKK